MSPILQSITIFSHTSSDSYHVVFLGTTIYGITRSDEFSEETDQDFNRLPPSIQTQILKAIARCQN